MLLLKSSLHALNVMSTSMLPHSIKLKPEEQIKLAILKNIHFFEINSVFQHEPFFQNIHFLNFYSKILILTEKDFVDCFTYFINAMYECTKIQAEHPFCVEDSPSYNPIMCAVKINQCCVEELAGIGECVSE